MINKIICLILDHDYFTVQKFSSWSRKVGCRRCRERWGMHDGLKVIIPWDKDLDDMYKSFGYELIEGYK